MTGPVRLLGDVLRGWALRLAFRSGYVEDRRPRTAKALYTVALGVGYTGAWLRGRS